MRESMKSDLRSMVSCGGLRQRACSWRIPRETQPVSLVRTRIRKMENRVNPEGLILRVCGVFFDAATLAYSRGGQIVTRLEPF